MACRPTWVSMGATAGPTLAANNKTVRVVGVVVSAIAAVAVMTAWNSAVCRPARVVVRSCSPPPPLAANTPPPPSLTCLSAGLYLKKVLGYPADTASQLVSNRNGERGRHREGCSWAGVRDPHLIPPPPLQTHHVCSRVCHHTTGSNLLAASSACVLPPALQHGAPPYPTPPHPTPFQRTSASSLPSCSPPSKIPTSASSMEGHCVPDPPAGCLPGRCSDGPLLGHPGVQLRLLCGE